MIQPRTLLAAILCLTALEAFGQHQLKPSPKTVAWGYYDASTPPVLRIKSGDTVEIQTLITSSPARLEAAGVPANQIEQSLRDNQDDEARDTVRLQRVQSGPRLYPGGLSVRENEDHPAR